MKYNYYNNFNLIILLLIFALSISLFSCDNGGGDMSNIDESKSTFALDLETAKRLVEQDRTITEMFVCNSLCTDSITKAERVTLLPDNDYYRFEKIEQLLASTYTAESEEKEFFLSYPSGKEPSVKNELGVTSVFKHSGSKYDGFVNPSTIAVADTEQENIKLINGYTDRGKAVSLRAACANGEWRIEKGIYLSYPPEKTDFSVYSDISRVGSFSSLKGNILVIELYITDDESQITESTERDFHKKVLESTNLLTLQASKYGVQTNFEFKSAYFEHKGELGDRVIDFDIMIAETGFGTLRSFAEDNYNLARYDNYVFAVCINKNIELSAGVYSTKSDTDFYYGERVIIGSEANSGDIFLKMLETLGAYDYQGGLLNKYTEALYSAYFPNDCFFAKDITLSELSPVNAYACGVTDELESLYRIFVTNKN